MKGKRGWVRTLQGWFCGVHSLPHSFFLKTLKHMNNMGSSIMTVKPGRERTIRMEITLVPKVL